MSFSSISTEEELLATYDEYADCIFRYCYLRIADREQGKQLMCETFKELWLFMARGNVVDSAKIFLFRTAHKLVEECRVEAEKFETMKDSISRMLTKFSEEHRPLFLLHFVEGLSCYEISEVLGGTSDQHSQSLEEMRALQDSLLAHAS